MAEPGWYERRGKRGLDLLLSALLLAALAPLLLLLALLVRTSLGPGVVFRQERAGRDGRPFTLLKLRTMREAAVPGEPDEARLGRLGRTLRACGLDELPQLVNVLRGEMSLIGPRPLPAAYTPLYSAREAGRLRVRPGLAGPAQAMGRNAVPWEARLEADARYAAGVTATGDLRAALGSLGVVLRGVGVGAPGQATGAPLSRPASRRAPVGPGRRGALRNLSDPFGNIP